MSHDNVVPQIAPEYRAVIICSWCRSVCPVSVQGISPWHPGLCLEIIPVISAIIVGTNNNILTIVVCTPKAAVRGKVVDGGWSFVFFDAVMSDLGPVPKL